MDKINFQNLPNTTTPVNATNLNQLQTNIENAINDKNIITAYLSASTANTFTTGTIPFNSSVSVGNKLTLTSNKIKIGAGVSKVKISGNVFVQYDDNNYNYLWIYAYKNNTDVAISINSGKNAFISTSLTERVINVQENDEISLYKYDDASATIRGTSNTWLTVEVIE